MRLPAHLLSGAAGAAVATATLLLAGAVRPAAQALPQVLDVQRINVREPDGTIRLVISGAAAEPGIIVDGREQPHPSRRSAGMLFYDEERTENGGLIFDGRRGADGRGRSGGSLTFDRYHQDQAVQLTADQDGPRRRAGLVVSDHPDAELDFQAIERARTLPPAERAAAFRAAHAGTVGRAFLGRERDGASELVLRDAAGLARLALRVEPGGAASVRFLDARGRTVRTLAP